MPKTKQKKLGQEKKNGLVATAYNSLQHSAQYFYSGLKYSPELQRQHDQRKIAFRADRTQAHQTRFLKVTIGLTTEPSNREDATHSSNLEWFVPSHL
jgi:hypothetical protein